MTRQVLVGLVVVATAGAAFAAGRERPRPRRDRAAIRQELGLSAEQESQLRSLRQETRKAAIQRRADLRLARLGLREALQAPSLDEGAVHAKAKQLADLRSAQFQANVETRLLLRKVLTPEQQEKLRTLRAERKADPLTRPDRQ